MTTTKLTTAEQFMQISDDGRFDLIDGEVFCVSPTQSWHGIVSGRLTLVLGMYALQRGGESPTAEPSFLVRRDPDSVLCPDAAYISAERMARVDLKAVGWFPFAPDIAVEVLSPSESRRTIARKVALYLAAGSAQVWVVDVRKQTLIVYAPDDEPRIYKHDDTLDGAEVLPGFKLPIAQIFR